MQKSLPITSNDKSLSLLWDIMLCATVLMSFLLLEVLSVVVDDTGIVIVPVKSYRILGNACFNDKTSKYKSTILFDFNYFNIGLST